MPEDIATIGRSYRHDVVRDMVWSVISPPLLRLSATDCQWFDDDWYLQRYHESVDWLRELDNDPKPLLEAVVEQKDKRLGNYFETLWGFWLEASQRYDLIERNLPVRDGGKTLGELDFLVRDNQTGLNYHWELAIKFYLGVADTRQRHNWYGPGKRDRLDIKLEHLRDRQSRICQLPQTKQLLGEKGIEVAGSAVVLKGRLFYPGTAVTGKCSPKDANESHLRGRWYRLSEFYAQIDKSDRFCPLIRSGWMADPGQVTEPGTKLYSWLDLHAAVKGGKYRLPLCLMRINREGYSRLFLVPDDWDRTL